MTYQEVLEQARGAMGPYCKACPVCNGLACRNTVPGPGAKGIGTGFIRNYQKWQELCVNMDTICENKPVDTSFTLFGRTVDLPVFAAPVGAMTLHYGDKYNDLAYNDILVAACAEAGIAAFTGDGTDPAVMEGAAAAIAKNGGCGVPTVKPWNLETIRQKMDLVKAADPFAIAMDIDAAGLPFLKNMTPPAGSKTVEELREIVAMAEKPFIVKGIMTVAGAKKALEAGAKGIVVSNHGGRVLDQCPSTAEVLPAIVDAVGGRMTILVDGGIRTGMDVFKALALGADAVLIGRPFVTMVYGAGAEGVKTYVEKLKAELADTMAMCGAHSLADISRSMLYGLCALPPLKNTAPPRVGGAALRCSLIPGPPGRHAASGPPPPAAPACGTSALRPPPQSGGSHSGRQRPPRSPGPSDGPGRRTGWPWASATGGQGGSGRIADIPRRGSGRTLWGCAPPGPAAPH